MNSTSLTRIAGPDVTCRGVAQLVWFVVFTTVVGCGSSSGDSANGGPSASSTGGAQTSDDPCGYPACFTELDASCSGSGHCMRTEANACFENGVKLQFDGSLSGTITCFKADGSVGYKFVHTATGYAYQDKSGATVIDVAVSSTAGQTQMTMTCGGAHYALKTSSDTCQGINVAANCDTGICTVP